MKKIMKISAIIVFLFAGLLPIEHSAFGQSGNKTFQAIFNLFEIQSVEKRLQLLNGLRNDEILDFRLGSKPGEIEVFSRFNNREESGIETDLDMVRHQLLLKNESLSKQELGDLYLICKKNLGEEIVEFALGDRSDRGDSCANADPFCTSNFYTFPAETNNYAENGPDYACLATQPNPSWFYMKIVLEGPLEITIFSTPSYDIDFICWGPFDDPVTPCSGGLVSSSVIDCSYSGSNTEVCNIPNALLNKYYILMITNYSNQPCDISMQKTGGTAETDCSFMPYACGSNSPVCVTEQLNLFTNYLSNATFLWTGPDGFSSTLQNPSISNVNVTNAGIYSLVISEGETQLDSITTVVEVNPMSSTDFTFTEVCRGEPTVFTDISTVNPPTSQITLWEWDFGDGNVATGQNQQYTYQSSGVYQVTLTTSTGVGLCAQSIIKQVMVKTNAEVSAGNDISLPYGWYTELTGVAIGGSGNYTFLWEPQALVIHPDSAQTNTLPMTSSGVFTLSVTDNAQGCVSTDEVSVAVTGSSFAVFATADPENVCLGELSLLHANAQGGSENYTYLWESIPAGFTSTAPDPYVSPTQTTTYMVTVFDGQNSLASSVIVTLKATPTANAGTDIAINQGESTILGGSVSGGSGTYVIDWQPANLLIDNSILQPTTIPLTTSVVFTLTITDDDSGCESIDDVLVTVSGGVLSVITTAVPEIICQGQSSQLSAIGSGGSGNYTYLWTTDPPSAWNSTVQNPLVTPDSTTIYQVQINDGSNYVIGSQDVGVMPLPEVSIDPDGYVSVNDTIFVCVHDSVWLDAGSGFEYLWMNGATSQIQLAQSVGDIEEIQVWSVVITDPQTGCQNSDELTIVFDFNTCTVGIDESSPTSQQVYIYPNPTSGSFTVGFNAIYHFSNLNVYSVNGVLLLSTTIREQELEQHHLLLDISNFENGVYFLQLQGNKSVVNKILIKK